ncbi:MAG: NAD(P)/FAD-dependent oxidoreductase [Candidatus Azobacteroides sp.]|nr:NAD(P)/FAD-dependent oxidoreductase [Candidatus Azobacteroides sp.]
MQIDIPKTSKKRVVVIGGGFAGISLINKLDQKLFQVVLIDKNNYHQFPPMLYQVAVSGMEPSSISFPLRRLFRKHKDFYFRLADVRSVNTGNNTIQTNIGEFFYDYLVIANGATTNFFGMKNIEDAALPMKSIDEAITLRNSLLLSLEEALNTSDMQVKRALLNIVIVGGGATGVEVAGAVAEMKKYVLPKDYPDLKDMPLNVYLIEGGPKLVPAMSEGASQHALDFLTEMGVNVLLNKRVVDYQDEHVKFDNGDSLITKNLIWVSGIVCEPLKGFSEDQIGHAGRLLVDEHNLVKGTKNIYAIGDACLQIEEKYPKGHPQVAPVGIQQGHKLAKNLKLLMENKPLETFNYFDKGTLATVGRNKAVADIHKIHLNGFSAWSIWLFVHLNYILGVKNKIFVLMDWIWNYINYDQSSRFIFYSKNKVQEKLDKEENV